MPNFEFKTNNEILFVFQKISWATEEQRPTCHASITTSHVPNVTHHTERATSAEPNINWETITDINLVFRLLSFWLRGKSGLPILYGDVVYWVLMGGIRSVLWIMSDAFPPTHVFCITKQRSKGNKIARRVK